MNPCPPQHSRHSSIASFVAHEQYAFNPLDVAWSSGNAEKSASGPLLVFSKRKYIRRMKSLVQWNANAIARTGNRLRCEC